MEGTGKGSGWVAEAISAWAQLYEREGPVWCPRVKVNYKAFRKQIAALNNAGADALIEMQ